MKEAGFDTKAAFIKRLRYLNLYNNKHIPDRYLYAPIEDRLALLQGLMDTGGTIDKRNGNVVLLNLIMIFVYNFKSF